ncbi:MAG: YybS family protein [Sporolactobacillus sp.]
MKDKNALVIGALSIVVLFVLIVLTVVGGLAALLMIWLIPIPVMYAAARLGWRYGLALLIAGIIFLLIFSQTVFVLLPFFMLAMGFVMGCVIRLKKSAFAVLLAGTLANCALLIISLGVSILLFHYNPIDAGMKEMLAFFQNAKEINPALGAQLKSMREYRSLFSELSYFAPSMLVMLSAFYALIVELISLPFLRAFHAEAPRWLPFRKWKLPKSVIWIYLFALIASNIGISKGTPVFEIAVNFQYIMQVLLAVQGLSFLYSAAHKRRLPLVIPIVLTILGLFRIETLIILGIIDLGFDLRQRIKKKE